MACRDKPALEPRFLREASHQRSGFGVIEVMRVVNHDERAFSLCGVDRVGEHRRGITEHGGSCVVWREPAQQRESCLRGAVSWAHGMPARDLPLEGAAQRCCFADPGASDDDGERLAIKSPLKQRALACPVDEELHGLVGCTSDENCSETEKCVKCNGDAIGTCQACSKSEEDVCKPGVLTCQRDRTFDWSCPTEAVSWRLLLPLMRDRRLGEACPLCHAKGVMLHHSRFEGPLRASWHGRPSRDIPRP